MPMRGQQGDPPGSRAVAGEHRCRPAETAPALALHQTVQGNLSVGKLKPSPVQGAAVRSIREGIEKEPAMPGGWRVQERGGGVAGGHGRGQKGTEQGTLGLA